MKESRDQQVLFPERLDEAVDADHDVRLVDKILQCVDFSEWEAKYHLAIGQPPIHPRVMASVILYGLLCRIDSSRALEEALQVRLDFRWLAEGRRIDHSTICIFRLGHAPNFTPATTVDIDSGIIVDSVVLGVVLGVVNEDNEMLPAVDRVQKNFDLPSPPERLLADGLMATGDTISQCSEQNIDLYSRIKGVDPTTNPAVRTALTEPVAEEGRDRLPLLFTHSSHPFQPDPPVTPAPVAPQRTQGKGGSQH